MKQTAVEWLASNLGEHIVWEEKLIDLVEQAKEMEKQQIIDFAENWSKQILRSDRNTNIQQYYNETFKSE
jgi:hypothetical protein